MNKVYIIGMGPGTADYLLPAATKELERADCLIGSKRLLSLLPYKDKKMIRLKCRTDEAVSYIKKNREAERIAVLVTGDPGLYSFLLPIRKAFKEDEYTVIPGISSMQLAFARIGDSWQDAKIISVHGRSKGNLAAEVKANDKVFLFTDAKFPPDKIAGYLLENGVKKRRAVVFEELTYPTERIVDTDLKTLSNMKGFGLCVMIIKK